MPTTTQPTNNSALPQALNELQKSTATFDSTKQAVTVIVKHLSGNLLNLSLATGLLNKPALLANPVIQGELSNGQAHQIRITDGSPPEIAFFSANKPAEKTLINLNNQQVDTLVKLSAKQLMAYLAQFKSVTFNATVLANSTSLIPTDTLSLSQQSAQPAAPSLAQGVNQLLKLKLTGMPATAEIEIQLKQPHKFSGGEKLALTVVPKGVNWQVNLATTGQQDIKQPQATSTNRQAPLPYSQSVLVAPDQSLNLTKSVIQQLSHSQSADIPLSTKLVLQQLKLIANSSTAATSAVQQLTQALQTQPIDKLSLVLNEQSHFQLKIETNKPTATIPITKEIAHALAPLKLPEQQRLIKLINQAAASELSPSPSDTQTVKQTPVDIQVKEDAAKPMTKIFSQLGEAAKKVLQLNKEPLAPGPQHIQKNEDAGKSTLLKQDSQLTLKELANQLLERVISSPLEKSVITPKLLTSTPQQVGLIQQMLRVAQAKAETLNVGMQNIEQALTDPELVKQGTDPNHKQLVEQLLQQTKTTLPQGKESDAQQIKQLLTSPAINLTPSQLVSATTNQGFISGLVAMLQMSLSARLTRAQTSRDDHVARALNAILPQSAKAKSALTGKGLNEFLQLEQKHQLAREIGRLFAGHQTNKLHNAEQLLQGQESVYYNIPALMNGTFQDVELLIKREEQQKEQNDQAASSHKTWQLTMKLTIGELGELLTKAKLRPDNLEVDFYASNQEVKIQVMNYLPLLKRKLESLGIEVSKSQCQLGKIPDSLQQRPYHVFQTKV